MKKEEISTLIEKRNNRWKANIKDNNDEMQNVIIYFPLEKDMIWWNEMKEIDYIEYLGN